MAIDRKFFEELAKLFDEWNKIQQIEVGKSKFREQQEEIEKAWNELVLIDLNWRKRRQLEREWNPPLTLEEKQTIEEIKPAYNKIQEHIEKLKLAVEKLERVSGRIVPPSVEKEDDYLIPFWAFRVKKNEGTEFYKSDPNYKLKDDDRTTEVLIEEVYTITYHKPSDLPVPLPPHQWIDAAETARLTDGRVAVKRHIGRKIKSFEWADGAGFKVDSLETYIRYHNGIKKAIESDYEHAPYRAGTKEIWTYEQFKLIILSTYPRDFLRVFVNKEREYLEKIVPSDYVLRTDKGEEFGETLSDGNKIVKYLDKSLKSRKGTLTFLCTFLEKFFMEEPLTPSKKHLKELLKTMESDFREYQPVFWEKISKYVNQVFSTIPTSDLHPDLATSIAELDDFITYKYSGWPEPYDFPNYIATRRGILEDYKVLLRELFFKYLNSGRLFYTAGKLMTQITTNMDFGEEAQKKGNISKQRLFERGDTHSSTEVPLKTSEAENLKEWSNYKAIVVKSQSINKTTEHLKNDNTVNIEGTGKKGRKAETRYIIRDIDPMDGKKLEWVEKAIQHFIIYKNIGAQLDKFFYASFDIPRDDFY